MKKISLIIALLLLVANSVRAEIFQFIDSETNSYLIYWAIHKSHSNQRLGFSDGLGRLRINNPRGQYSITLRYRGRPDKYAQIKVRGNNNTIQIFVH